MKAVPGAGHTTHKDLTRNVCQQTQVIAVRTLPGAWIQESCCENPGACHFGTVCKNGNIVPHIIPDMGYMGHATMQPATMAKAATMAHAAVMAVAATMADAATMALCSCSARNSRDGAAHVSGCHQVWCEVLWKQAVIMLHMPRAGARLGVRGRVDEQRCCCTHLGLAPGRV